MTFETEIYDSFPYSIAFGGFYPWLPNTANKKANVISFPTLA
jgi:hypothetical protein